ncbi:MAG: hypothetical protein LBJ35_03725 [Spirochaetaceae bacterium]|nr:hypothetical protein [Spirochaetaceae bacterium]
MKNDLPLPFDEALTFQALLDGTCDKLLQKNAALTLIRLSELDSILSDVEKTLSRVLR